MAMMLMVGGTYPHGGDDYTCAICIEDFKEGDDTVRTGCGHLFHRSCLPTWLETNCICPICRADLTGWAATAGFQCGSGAALPAYSHGTDGDMAQPLDDDDMAMAIAMEQNEAPLPDEDGGETDDDTDDDTTDDESSIDPPDELRISGGTPLDGDYELYVVYESDIEVSIFCKTQSGMGVPKEFQLTGGVDALWGFSYMRNINFMEGSDDYKVESLVTGKDMWEAGMWDGEARGYRPHVNALLRRLLEDMQASLRRTGDQSLRRITLELLRNDTPYNPIKIRTTMWVARRSDTGDVLIERAGRGPGTGMTLRGRSTWRLETPMAAHEHTESNDRLINDRGELRMAEIGELISAMMTLPPGQVRV